MTRKDFKAVAKAFKTSLEGNLTIEAYSAVCQTADKVANAIKENNANFNKNKFLEACGMDIS